MGLTALLVVAGWAQGKLTQVGARAQTAYRLNRLMRIIYIMLNHVRTSVLPAIGTAICFSPSDVAALRRCPKHNPLLPQRHLRTIDRTAAGEMLDCFFDSDGYGHQLMPVPMVGLLS